MIKSRQYQPSSVLNPLLGDVELIAENFETRERSNWRPGDHKHLLRSADCPLL